MASPPNAPPNVPPDAAPDALQDPVAGSTGPDVPDDSPYEVTCFKWCQRTALHTWLPAKTRAAMADQYRDAMRIRRDVLGDPETAGPLQRGFYNDGDDRGDDPRALHLVLYLREPCTVPDSGSPQQELRRVPVGTLRIVAHIAGFECPSAGGSFDPYTLHFFEKMESYRLNFNRDYEPFEPPTKYFRLDKLAVLPRYAERVGGWVETKLINEAVKTLQEMFLEQRSDPASRSNLADALFQWLEPDAEKFPLEEFPERHDEWKRKMWHFDWIGTVVAPGAGRSVAQRRIWEACWFAQVRDPQTQTVANIHGVVGMYMRRWPPLLRRGPPADEQEDTNRE